MRVINKCVFTTHSELGCVFRTPTPETFFLFFLSLSVFFTHTQTHNSSQNLFVLHFTVFSLIFFQINNSNRSNQVLFWNYSMILMTFMQRGEKKFAKLKQCPRAHDHFHIQNNGMMNSICLLKSNHSCRRTREIILRAHIITGVRHDSRRQRWSCVRYVRRLSLSGPHLATECVCDICGGICLRRTLITNNNSARIFFPLYPLPAGSSQTIIWLRLCSCMEYFQLYSNLHRRFRTRVLWIK